VNVADGKDPGATRLQEQRSVAVELRDQLALKVS
jgi:hypothetical protein